MTAPLPRRLGRPPNPGGALTSAERAARARAKRRDEGMRRLSDVWLHPAESAALDRLTADGATVRDAVGAAIVLAARHPPNR